MVCEVEWVMCEVEWMVWCVRWSGVMCEVECDGCRLQQCISTKC